MINNVKYRYKYEFNWIYMRVWQHTLSALVVLRLGYLPSKQATRVRLPADACLFAISKVVHSNVIFVCLYR